MQKSEGVLSRGGLSEGVFVQGGFVLRGFCPTFRHNAVRAKCHQCKKKFQVECMNVKICKLMYFKILYLYFCDLVNIIYFKFK